jgi:putative component of toxin-antitoxin plasmid stabilization module
MGEKTAFNKVLSKIKNRTYPNRIALRIKNISASRLNDFLKHITGVIHVGANIGQECQTYAQNNLDVLWIEPIPDIFERLTKNIACYPKQKAVNALVTDKDGEEYAFNISSNYGNSSSILVD